MASQFLRAAVGLSLAALCHPLHASERGTSFYLLGSGGPGAALLPPVPGIFFDDNFFHYRGRSQGTKQFVVGGAVVAGLRAGVDANFDSVLWVPSTDFAGGKLAIGATFVFGRPEADVSAVITGPPRTHVPISKTDSAWVIGDPVAASELSWNVGPTTHVAAIVTASLPIGEYRHNELANLSFHRWIVDLSDAATWRDQKAGWDVSGKAGVTFNGKNRFTDYKTGTEFHIEASVERQLSNALSIGIQAYHFEQISGDSGGGALLGPFEGRVSAVGLTASYGFSAAGRPMTLRGRLFEEFGAKNRLAEGSSMMVDFAIPLKMILPSQAANSPKY